MLALKSARLLVGSFVFCSWSFAVQAQNCEKNEDCGANMVCFEQTLTQCSGGASTATCAPNEKCEAPAPEQTMCSEVTEKLCIPRYLLPCQADTDCGDGFTCEANMACSCSGSGGSGSASGSSDPQPAEDAGASYKAAFAAPVSPKPLPAADGGVMTDAGSMPVQDAGAPTCECHALETKHCVAKVIKCQTDSECPSAFSCVAYAAVDCAVSKDSDAAVCGASTTDKVCAPRYNSADYGTGRGTSEDAAHDAGAAVSGKDDKGTSEAPTANGTSDAGVAPSAPQQDAGAMPENKNATCSAAAPGAHKGSTGLVLGIALLGLSLITRKRARR